MKRKQPRRNRRKIGLILAMRILLSATALAVEPGNGDPALLNAIHEMRMKQQAEENNSVVRVIQQPMRAQNCSPVEQARQRIRDMGAKEGKAVGQVNVEAGHGEVKIDGNSGTVNNAVNVQVVNPNDRTCP